MRVRTHTDTHTDTHTHRHTHRHTHTHTQTHTHAVRGTGKAGPREQTLNMQLKLGLSEVGQLRAAGQGGEG